MERERIRAVEKALKEALDIIEQNKAKDKRLANRLSLIEHSIEIALKSGSNMEMK